MTCDEMLPGVRVRLIRRIGGRDPGSMYLIEPGITGVVIKVDQDDFSEDTIEPYAFIRLDVRHPDLDAWDNVLHVWRDPPYEGGDALCSDFELIEP